MRRDFGTPILVAVGIAGVVLAAAALPWLRFVLTIALAKGLMVLGIVLLLRAGQVSFGHGLFVAGAAYAVAFTARGIGADALLLLPLGALAAGAVGVVVGAFVVRYRDIFFAMLNLAFSMVFYSIIEKLYTWTHGSDGLRVEQPSFLFQRLDPQSYEWAIFATALVLAVLAGWVVHHYLRSPLGQALSAIKTRETRLEFAGISARRVLLSAYVGSAVLAGLGGAIVAMTTRHVVPALSYWTYSGELVFIAILGGAGHVIGAFAGAVVFELVRIYAGAFAADAWQLILGTVLLGIILFASRGLWGLYEDLTRRRAKPGAA
jgi:branched-chain amino acid transport system permease protein